LGNLGAKLLAGILANFPQAVVQGLAQAASHIRREMPDKAFTSMANFVNGQHDAWLGVVIVVAYCNAP
jgi:hypothetical protein